MGSHPFLLFIDRGESDGHCWPRIRRNAAFRWLQEPADLAWCIGCPEDQLVISRCGPVHLAHGGDWARARELECFRWSLVDPLVLSGKAVAVRPDSDWGGWRALSEWEAGNAERVLRRYGDPITRACSSRWDAVVRQLSGERLLRYVGGTREEQAEILQEFALELHRRRRREQLAIR
jgi:hypothetical protein